MGRSYTEGNLSFTFSNGWMVRKYDHHTFYQGLSGAGLKGVDFIAVRPHQLLLVEVKNYRHVRNGRRRATVARSLEDPQAIADAIARKGWDTLRAIKAIHTYYRRKLDYRLFAPLLHQFWWAWSDRSFWTHAAREAQSPSSATFLLWLATDPNDRNLAEDLRPILETDWNGRFGQVLITDQTNLSEWDIQVRFREKEP